MKAKFTKGEWKIPNDSPTFIYASKNDGSNAFDCCVQGYYTTKEELQANAHLIACAPEMYKMIDELHRELNSAINEINMHRSLVINSQTETEPDYWDAQSCFEAQLLLKKARGE